MTTDKQIEDFVRDILDCYQAIENSYNQHSESEKERIKNLSKRPIRFLDFDQTDEMPYAMKVKDLRKNDMETIGRELAHIPMVGIYRQIIDRWQAIGRRQELSAEQIIEILGE